MSPIKHMVTLPVTTEVVKGFVNDKWDTFEVDLKAVITIVTGALKRNGVSVYKIYGRDEKQEGNILKTPRKIRLKFNDLNKGKTEASLFDVPDIIGFTLVVEYPSDINKVCNVIDKLIDNNNLLNADQKPKVLHELIDSKYGEPKTSRGYFACHYNVRKPGVGRDRPICEIQIKTILGDVWGNKSHDLTFKPSAAISSDLIQGFNMLGDTVAKIDQQANLICGRIRRTNLLLDAKKKRIQKEIIRSEARVAAEADARVLKLVEQIELLKVHPSDAAAALTLSRSLFELFGSEQNIRGLVCIALVLLALQTNHQSDFAQARETIAIWAENTKDMDAVHAYAVAALASYASGDTAGAIEATDEGVRIISSLDSSGMNDSERNDLNVRRLSLYSNLAYYHAELIGSHEGRLSESGSYAIKYLAKAAEYRKSAQLPADGLDSSDDLIANALADMEFGWPVFGSLDSEAFVKIQTVENIVRVSCG
jgi:ppGpp synthetase/RelA/SpoT-type nucleotidyltranferase